MDLKARFSIVLAFVISILAAVLCVLVYIQVKEKLISTAKQTLAEHMEHEWKHLEMHNGEISGPSKTLQNENIHYRIIKDGRIVVDTLPRAIATSPEKGLVQKLERTQGAKSIELVGNYDLHGLHSYLTALRGVLILACLMTVLFVIPLSWFFTKALLRPFSNLATGTAELNAENLSFRFPLPRRRDEYGTLTSNFNALLARLEKSFEQTRRFATNASHELRTPLAIIRGEADILLRKPREVGEYEAGLRNIVGQSQHLQHMVNRLLFLANLERMTSEPRNTSIDIEKVISGTMATLRTVYPTEVRVMELKAGGRPFLTGHKELFSSVVTNLLENAVKYSKERILVQVREEQDGLHVDIDDDGPGIPDAFKEEVFEPLFKAPNAPGTGANTKKGTGLGLSIVKACVDTARGKIRLEDSPLGGLGVRLFFPKPA